MPRVRDTLEGGHAPATDPPHMPVTTSTVEDRYGDWNKADLKAEAARRSLHVSGSKTQIVTRLEEDDNATEV